MRIYLANSSIKKEILVSASLTIFFLMLFLQAQEVQKQIFIAFLILLSVSIAGFALFRLKLPLFELRENQLFYRGFFHTYPLKLLGIGRFLARKYLKFSTGKRKINVATSSIAAADLEKLIEKAEFIETKAVQNNS